MSEETISIHLTASEALVLQGFLCRFSQDERLEIQHPAEERVLWDLCCDLERVLAAPFAPDFQQQLETARAVVAAGEAADPGKPNFQ